MLSLQTPQLLVVPLHKSEREKFESASERASGHAEFFFAKWSAERRHEDSKKRLLYLLSILFALSFKGIIPNFKVQHLVAVFNKKVHLKG